MLSFILGNTHHIYVPSYMNIGLPKSNYFPFRTQHLTKCVYRFGPNLCRLVRRHVGCSRTRVTGTREYLAFLTDLSRESLAITLTVYQMEFIKLIFSCGHLLHLDSKLQMLIHSEQIQNFRCHIFSQNYLEKISCHQNVRKKQILLMTFINFR